MQLLSVLVQGRQLGPEHIKSLPVVSLLQKFQKLLLPYVEPHAVAVSFFRQNQSVSGLI